MQEYEQHLVGLGVKPGSKKEQRFHPYKKNKRGRGGRQQAPQGVYYQPMPAPQYMVQQPFFQPPLKEEPDSINRVVSVSTDFQTNFQTLGESPSGPVRNQPEQKTSYICLFDSGMGSRCPPAAQGCTKTSITNMQDNSDSPRLADTTMVLGPGGDVSGHSKTTTTHTHSAKTTTEQPIPCQPKIPEPPHLVSRSSALQEHGFTAEVAERIAAPQRLSTRSIYTSK